MSEAKINYMPVAIALLSSSPTGYLALAMDAAGKDTLTFGSQEQQQRVGEKFIREEIDEDGLYTATFVSKDEAEAWAEKQQAEAEGKVQ